MRTLLDTFQQKYLRPGEEGNHPLLYVYKRLYRYIKPYWWRALIAIFITIPIGSMDAAIAFSLKPFMDGVLSKQGVHVAGSVPFIIIGFTLVQGILVYFSIYLNGWLGFRIVSDIRADLFKKLQMMEVPYYDQTTSGGIIFRYYQDPEILQNNVINNVREFLTRIFSSISLLTVLFVTSWQLALIAMVTLPCILFPSTHIKTIMRNLSMQMTQTATDMLSFYNETTAGIRVIYSYNLMEHRTQQFVSFQRSILSKSMKLIKSQGWLTPSMHIIASLGIATIIWAGTNMVVSGALTTGAMASFVAALIMLYNPIKNLGNTIMATQHSLLAAGRVFDVLDMEPGIQDAPDAVAIAGIEQGIEFRNVRFRYAPEKPEVLEDINLTFKKGETVALVGDSGSGKSTIASLIPRFYDVTEGAILLDGRDIRSITMASLRHQISLVTQENFLFNGTLRENILMGNLSATEEELQDAVDKAYLRPFVDSLEAGLETFIGERGVLLSGGQRQRVAIARALIKNAPIVLLDEATSALDNKSEAIVQKAIESLMVDRTVIVIAHRLSTIKNADRIVVLSHGRIAEEGTHEELLSHDGIYAMLYQTQFKTATASPPAIPESAEPEAEPIEIAVSTL